MEAGTGNEVSARRIGFVEAFKIVIGPLAVVLGVLGTVGIFAFNKYVEDIVEAKIAGVVTGNSQASELLTQYGSKLEVHERDIGENSTDIDKVDDKFTEFVREILARL